jgi:uncharacterized protein (UPF0335 family)
LCQPGAKAIVPAMLRGQHHHWGRGIMPDVEGIAGAQLKSFIERIERLEEEKRALGEDIWAASVQLIGDLVDARLRADVVLAR